MKLFLFVLSISNLLFLSSFRSNSIDQFADRILDTVKKDTLKLDTISVKFSVVQKYENLKKEYRTIYMWGDNKNAVKINPFGGIAIDINKIYSHFSKIGKNSRRLQKVFDSEFEMDSINLLWKPFSEKYSNLKGDSLFYFQMYFLPKLSFIENATYYEKVEYVIKSMRIYRDSTEVIHNRMKLLM